MMDATSKAILEILKNEARVTEREIARRLQIPEDQVAGTISKLEDERVIQGYRAVVDPERLDEEPMMGIIQLKLCPQRNRGYDAIAEQIYRFPEVKLCYLISGDFDLLVFVEGHSLKQVALFVTEKLATLEHVQTTSTHFILKKYKESGIIMGGERSAERLAVTP